jgi:membrane protein implicated in regulation of membrane protease activity
MTRVTSTQPQHNGRHAKPERPPEAPSLPLVPDQARQPGEASLGDLVREATTHFSTLIRSEVELAKAEVTAEIRKGIKGSVLFIVALAILLFSLFFLFIAVGEVLAVWLPRWAAFSIVFGLMLLSAAVSALIGWRRVRSIRKPKRTIMAVRETGEVFTHLRPNHQHADAQHDDHLADYPEIPDPLHGDDERSGAPRADRQQE